jgi:NADH-quinone oxidoreductase subunit N
MSILQLTNMLPFEIIAGLILILLLYISFFRGFVFSFILTISGLAMAIFSIPAFLPGTPQSLGILVLDNFTIFFLYLVFGASIAAAVLGYDYFRTRLHDKSEFFILLLLACLGAGLLCSSINLLSFVLALELLSISLYGLIGFSRSAGGIEAALKYLILAGFSSGFVLLGVALLYFQFGSMDLFDIAARFNLGSTLLPVCGIILMMVGIGFKLALVPFHPWTPEVYAGSPPPAAALIASVSKASVLAFLIRFSDILNIAQLKPVYTVFAVVAITSMLFGSLLALFESNIKRILAYSSIANMGYIMVAVLAFGQDAVSAALFYILAYVVTILCAFGTISILSRESDFDSIESVRSLAYRHPLPCVILTVSMLSLAGLPVTAGFVGKIYLLMAGISSSLWLLSMVLVTASAISLYYYLRVISIMYSRPGINYSRTRLSFVRIWPSVLILIILLVCVAWLGIYPGPIIDIINHALPASMY